MKLTQIKNIKDKQSQHHLSTRKTQDASSFIEDNPEIVMKSSAKRKEYRKMREFKESVFNEEERNQREFIKSNVKFNLFEFYSSFNLGESYKDEIYDNLSSVAMENKMKELNLNPKIFYIDDELFVKEDEIFQFLINILKFLRNDEQNQRFYDLQNIILSRDPKLKIMLSNTFDIRPGFILIDI